MISQLTKDIAVHLTRNHWTISVAESCTGGLVSKYLTERGGASSYFTYGLVTYCNDSKRKLLGVSEQTLTTTGAVSEECAFEMLAGLKKVSQTDIGVVITGIAGPSGGSLDKPIGTVFIGIYTPQYKKISRYQFAGNRIEIREQACQKAFEKVLANE